MSPPSPAFLLAKACGGPYTLAVSDPQNVVLHYAHFLCNCGLGSYCLCNKNCEDFAIYCKISLLTENTDFSFGWPFQLSFITAVTSAPIHFLIFNGLAGVSACMFCAGHYVVDIGIKRDVI
ncbi:Lecithin retinol acyltransferase [Carex littledalei]|uniref:Lecithin retinol acyltransferase n=1 Tax=Carex littledalei TaxID=544730 RepID=A0A833V9U4_9POAL|nr:Lecithin retinol acyltransferase [Carex littledalei]